MTSWNVSQVDLPKWPQMRVLGRPIRPAQAREIIARTDTFWSGSGGNNYRFNQELANRVGFGYLDYSQRNSNWQAIYQQQENFRASIGYVSTEYVYNSWISSAFIFGPTGWCHPNGRIHFAHNVGKWPSLDDIVCDWQTIAREWPFLDLDVCLMSGESSEDDSRPLAILCVQSGAVTAHDPAVVEFGSRFGSVTENFATPIDKFTVMGLLTGRTAENTFTVEQVAHMVDAVRQRKTA